MRKRGLVVVGGGKGGEWKRGKTAFVIRNTIISSLVLKNNFIILDENIKKNYCKSHTFL